MPLQINHKLASALYYIASKAKGIGPNRNDQEWLSEMRCADIMTLKTCN